MTNWTATSYASEAEFLTAVKAVANTVTIHVVTSKEAGKQKFILITNA